jgi:hypothetical protein
MHTYDAVGLQLQHPDSTGDVGQYRSLDRDGRSSTLRDEWVAQDDISDNLPYNKHCNQMPSLTADQRLGLSL